MFSVDTLKIIFNLQFLICNEYQILNEKVIRGAMHAYSTVVD